MMKKSKKSLIFSNDDNLNLSMNPRGTRSKTLNTTESSAKIRSFDFNYNFKEYLRLSLSKLILRDDSAITYIPEKKIVIGQQAKCRNLINKVLDELNRYKFKLVTFISDHDLDEIQYWLEEGATIYRPGVIEVALKQLEKKQLFLEDCQNFREKMSTNNIILLRVQRDKEESNVRLIKQVIDQGEQKKKQQSATASQTYLDAGLSITEKSVNISNMLKDIQGEKGGSRPENQIQKESESSYFFTQNDSSVFRESFNIYFERNVVPKQLQQPSWS